MCHTCHNVKETETFTSATTDNTFKINHKLNCHDKCLVYLLTFNVCLKQYVVQTVKECRYRWNYSARTMVVMVKRHMYAATSFWAFFWGGHHSFLEDASITLINKTDPWNHLQRENYRRSTLKTMASWELNVEDWNSILLYFYHCICTDYNKDLVYGNDFCTDYYWITEHINTKMFINKTWKISRPGMELNHCTAQGNFYNLCNSYVIDTDCPFK